MFSKNATSYLFPEMLAELFGTECDATVSKRHVAATLSENAANYSLSYIANDATCIIA
jgi:hypothetical protein